MKFFKCLFFIFLFCLLNISVLAQNFTADKTSDVCNSYTDGCILSWEIIESNTSPLYEPAVNEISYFSGRNYDILRVTATEPDTNKWIFDSWIYADTGEKIWHGSYVPGTPGTFIYDAVLPFSVNENGEHVYYLTGDAYGCWYLYDFLNDWGGILPLFEQVWTIKKDENGEYQNEQFHNSDNYARINIYCENNDVPEITVDQRREISAYEINVIRDFDASRAYYFSLPFDCDYNHITVTKNGIDCKATGYDTDGDCNAAEGDVWGLYEFNESRHSTANAVDGYAYDHIDDPTSFVIKRGIGYVFVAPSTNADDKVRITFREGNKLSKFYSYEHPYPTWLTFANTYNPASDYTISEGLSYTSNTIPENGAAYAGWNLVGNPYYAAVSETDFQLGSHTWQEDCVGYISRLDENNNFECSRTSQANVVPAFISFFAKVPQGDPVTLTVTSPYSTQRSGLRHKEIEKNISLKLSRQGTYCDKTSVVINNSASLAYDDQEDLAKIINPGAAVIYSLADDVKCEFNVLSLTGNCQVIPLGLYVWQNGSFTFALDSKKTNFDGSVTLVDNQKATRINLTNSKSTTTLSRGDIENRFYLEIEAPQEAPESVTPVDNVLEDMGISTYVNAGVLHVEGLETVALVTVVDASGRQIASAVTDDSCEFDLQQRGVYIVTVNGVSVKVVY